MSDTPRTDAAIAAQWGNGFAAKHLQPIMRQLERELAEARAQEQIHADNCESMRRQRDTLAEALREACAYPTTGNWYQAAQDALAELEGGQDE